MKEVLMRFKALSLGLVAVLAVSCTDQATSPTALNDAAVPAPSFGIGNAPAASGPNLIRYQGTFGYIINDPKRGIQALFGLDPADVCGFDFDLVYIQEITLPNEEVDRIVSVLQGDNIQTSVWDFTGFNCVLYGSETPLATGYSRLINTDNDLVGFLTDRENANAFGVNAHGQLDNGMLNAHERISWDPEPPLFDGRFIVTEVVNFH
jgi:hypothetical protein